MLDFERRIKMYGIGMDVRKVWEEKNLEGEMWSRVAEPTGEDDVADA